MIDKHRVVLYSAFFFLLFIKIGFSQIDEKSSNKNNSATNESRIIHNAIGVEFMVTPSSKKTFKSNGAITFTGYGSSSDGGDLQWFEEQNKRVEIETKYREYDLGIFYRIKRFKLGWIPTAFNSRNNSNGFLTYDFVTSDGKSAILGGYKFDTKRLNLGYLEIYGFKVRDIGNSNLFANVSARLDRYKIKGEYVSYKFPYGDEWNQPPIILDTNSFDNSLYLLSIGPKMAIDFNTLSQVANNPFSYFKGVDLLVLFDIPIGNNNFDVEGYSFVGSLVLEF